MKQTDLREKQSWRTRHVFRFLPTSDDRQEGAQQCVRGATMHAVCNNALRQAEASAIIRTADDIHERHLQEEDMVWLRLQFGH